MDRIYFNDEWNEPKRLTMSNPDIKHYQLLYDIMFENMSKMFWDKLVEAHTDGKTVLPKEYDKEKN